MKPFIAIVAVLLVVGFSVSLALANPALLPKHEGYPSGNAVSPVTGQPLANDPGRANATGEKALLEGAASEDAHVSQNLADENNMRVVAKEGAGQLPKVQGPQIIVAPPVTSATKIGTDRVIQ